MTSGNFVNAGLLDICGYEIIELSRSHYVTLSIIILRSEMVPDALCKEYLR